MNILFQITTPGTTWIEDPVSFIGGPWLRHDQIPYSEFNSVVQSESFAMFGSWSAYVQVIIDETSGISNICAAAFQTNGV